MGDCLPGLETVYSNNVLQASIIYFGGHGIVMFHCLFNSLYSLVEKAMALHSSTLAWKIPWTEEPGRLQPMGSLRVGHD